MKYTGQKVTPLKKNVAFTWIKPRNKLLVLPSTIYGLAPQEGQSDGMRVGRWYIGKLVAIGPEVDFLKVGDMILINEYGVRSYSGEWKEDELYFAYEKEVIGTLDKLPGSFFDIRNGQAAFNSLKNYTEAQEAACPDPKK